MAAEFIGRKRELARLNAAWTSGKFELVVLYGRRRVGKSCLLKHFFADKLGIYYQALRKNNLEAMSSCVSGYIHGNPEILYPSFSSMFRDIASVSKEKRMYFVIDEIPYLAEEAEIISLLQQFVDNVFDSTQLMLVLCGSSRRFMEQEVLAEPSPLYGRRTMQIKLLPFRPEESAEFFPRSWSLRDIAAAHTICSGIPYYERFLAGYLSLEEGIRSEFFSPRTLFYEARLYLMSEYRAVESYNALLGSLAAGKNEVKALSDKSKLSVANISAMLDSLERQEIVRRNGKILGRGRSRGWKLVDGYLAFYFRYVHGYIDQIEEDSAEGPYRKAMEELDTFVGRFLKKDFRSYVLRTSEESIKAIGPLEFPNPVTKQNEEIDLVADAGDSVIVGECKWKSARTGIDEFETLMKRGAMLFPSEPVKYCILSRSGFTEELTAAAEGRNDLRLITGHELFGMQ